MQIESTPLSGLVVIKPQIFSDDRGWFLESYHQERFRENGVNVDFVQDNHSRSIKGTLRGLHFQSHPGQAKLIRCTAGRIWDVAVDIRPESPTFKKWYGLNIDAETGTQIFIPVGFAHGFVVLSEWAEVQYKCSWFYDAKTESGFRWNDASIGVEWPLAGITPILSKRDLIASDFLSLFPPKF
jgi:dTDP-4-dehydrorhamnose 3,5-epimerase